MKIHWIDGTWTLTEESHPNSCTPFAKRGDIETGFYVTLKDTSVRIIAMWSAIKYIETGKK